MDTNTEFARGSVALIGLTSRDCGRARDAVTLAGARVCSDLSRAVLVLAAPGVPVPALVPCVRVGAGGQVVLPGDTALLVSLIVEASWRCARTGPVWVVAGIAGGIGVTSLVRMLAREGVRPPWWRRLGRGRHSSGRRPWRGRARGVEEAPDAKKERAPSLVVVDASGSVPGVARARDHDLPGVRWADLEVTEDSYLPGLLDHLPLIDGVPALVGDERGGVGADDPRVAAACRSIGAPLIVDAGRWNRHSAHLTEAIRADAIILLTYGNLEGAAAMAACLAASPPPCPALTLVVGERAERSCGLLECAPGAILRAPTRRGRHLRALRRALAAYGSPSERSMSDRAQERSARGVPEWIDALDLPAVGHRASTDEWDHSLLLEA